MFIAAIGVNTISVYLQKKYSFYDRFSISSHSLHKIVIAPLWLLFIGLYIWLEFNGVQTVGSSIVLGLTIKVVAVCIFALSLRQIGTGALTNRDVFNHKRRTLGGVYNYIAEPIYTSYTLFIIGSAVTTGVGVFYYLSLISLIGLQVIEAKIEN